MPITSVVRQKFSNGNKCECNCHGREGTIEYCGYLPIPIEIHFLKAEQEDNNILYL